jgi:hypothetical protein
MNKKSISTNNGLKGGFLKGKPHYDKNGNSLGGIKAVVTDQGGQPVELEGGEAILRKSAMESDKEFVVKGTPKEIASTLNQEFDGRAIGDSEAEILAKYREGGELIKRADGSYSKRGLWDNIRDNIGSGRKPTKEMLRQEALIKEKYHLGGDMSKHLAPNGKPSNLTHEQWHLVRTPEFKAWFGDWETAYETGNYDNVSKVIDDNGEPLVVYHGTPNGGFNIFKDEYKGLRTNHSYKDVGFHFSNEIEYAQQYSGEYNLKYHKEVLKLLGYIPENLKVSEKAMTYNVFLNIRNPKYIPNYIINEEIIIIALKNNQDGIIGTVKDLNRKEYVAFEPNQIKLADGSNTTFDANNDDIRFAEGGSIPEQGTLYTKDKKTKLEYIKNGSDYEFIVYEAEENPVEGYKRNQYKRHNKNKAIMNYNQFIDYLYTESYLHDKFKEGGSIKPNFSKMSESEIKEFYNSPEGRKLDAETYSEWKKLVNMSKSELENFYNSEEGKEAGLSQEEANRQGIDSGRESARWIMKMKDIPYTEWTSNMWRWAKKQISFIKRMSGMKGELYDDNGNKTRKHTSLLIWGHNPAKKFAEGGGIESNFKANFELWVDKLNRNRQLPIEFTTSKSIEGVHKDSGYGDSYYIMIFDENWNQYAKLRFSGHSVSNINRVKDEIHNPNISRFYEIVSRAMSKKQQEENPEELIKFKDGGSIEKNKEMEKKEIFYAYTNGKKYEIKAYDNLTYESFTNGSSNGSGSALNREDLKRTLYKKIEGSKLIDGINYIIVKDDILGEKEYDYTDYESVKELTKSLIEKYNNEVDSTGKKNKGTKINIEARIDSLFRLVDENPSKYLQDFIDFNNSLPKSFSISANIIFEKFDYSSNDNIINYLVETKKNPFDFYNISPYKLPKTKNFKVSPNDKVFMGIHDDFIGNDFLRPIMTGTYFSEKGVVSTNAHILLFTKNRGGEESFEGVYCHTKKCIEESKDGKIEGKFPNYEAVIPSTQDYTKNVNAEYLLTYLKNANKYRLFNSVTHASILYFETSEGAYKIGVNTELLASCIEAMIELGHKEISLNFIEPNRAITITPRGKTNEDARDLKTDFALCMPVMISKFREIDIFMYDLDTNCSKYIYNESIYCFDYEHTERENFKKEVREVKELKEQLKSELAKGTEHSKFEENFEQLLNNEGWSVNYYDYSSTDTVDKDKATEIQVYKLEPYYESQTLKLPSKMKVTFEWVMNKITKDKVYKTFSEDFNKLLKLKGYEKINAYPTTYGIGIFVGFGLNIPKTKEKIEFLLDSLGISYDTEYSDARYVFRYKISKSKQNIDKIQKIDVLVKSELAKGTEHEMEHLETLKKVAEGKVTPEEAVVQTAKTHIAENPNYYEDLAKMEAENEVKVSNIDNLMSIMDSKIKNQGYSLKELYDEVISMQGSRDGALIFSEFIKRKKDEGDTKIMDEFNKTSFVENINPVKEPENEEYSKGLYFKDYMNWKKEKGDKPSFKDLGDGLYEYDKFLSFSHQPLDKARFEFVTKKGDKFIYRDLDDEIIKWENYRNTENKIKHEESIPDLIEGLKVLLEYTEGEEKTELENTIEGLKLLLDDEKFAEGGEFRMKKGGNIEFKPITIPL